MICVCHQKVLHMNISANERGSEQQSHTVKLVYHLTIRNVVFCLACLWVSMTTSGCTRLFFYPQAQYLAYPSDFGYRYDEVQVLARDEITLRGWLIHPTGVPRGTIYFLHGNAENISTHTRSVHWLVDKGYGVLALDYRGFGASDGIPDVDEVLSDIDVGAEWLSSYLRKDPTSDENAVSEPVFLLGQSLGGALAIRYMDLYRESAQLFDALVVEAAFSSYGLIGRQVAARSRVTWVFQLPVQWLLPNRHDPIAAIQRLQDTPIKILHSIDDHIVTFSHGQALWDNSNQSISSLLTTTGRHVGAFEHEDVRNSVLDFFAKHR